MITDTAALQRTIEHREIFHDEMVDLMRQIMRGEVPPTLIAAILIGLRVKTESVSEIAAAAQVATQNDKAKVFRSEQRAFAHM